jgi:hypothetical protein
MAVVSEALAEPPICAMSLLVLCQPLIGAEPPILRGLKSDRLSDVSGRSATRFSERKINF